MSVWHVQIHHITSWSSTSGWHFPGEIDKIFKGLQNILCIADDDVPISLLAGTMIEP